MLPPTLAETPAPHGTEFAQEAACYLSLTPRQLPSRYLYDELGSALFETICRLPWYRITRLEQGLLRCHANEIFLRQPSISTVIELGPGNGEKLVTLMDARDCRAKAVHLVDVSANALMAAGRALTGYSGVSVVPHQATYEAGLAEACRQHERRRDGHALVMFLGSNIGNFDPPGADALLHGVRSSMTPGDLLLLGTDLVQSESELLLAYDDPLGVTAAFNKNLLVRANRELGSDFDLAGFIHRAVWNHQASRVEMHLVSVRRQQVRVPDAGLEIAFERDDIIWTESSYKYRGGDVQAMLTRAGFAIFDQWRADHFALTLAVSA